MHPKPFGCIHWPPIKDLPVPNTIWHYAIRGNGVEKNPSEAVRWLTLAADQGNAKVQYRLALRYHSGDVIQKNRSEALRLFTLAANQGHADALALSNGEWEV